MSTTEFVPIENLTLDLHNFRTVFQPSEASSVHAMISINPDWFWALMDSIIEDGYLPTENIILLKDGRKMIVKEGNRRIGALKIIFGELSKEGLALPISIAERIAKLDEEWKRINSAVPCAIYEMAEAGIVDRIVALTHGKGEKAGRDKWNAVAKSRHNRDKSGASEPALDLLEKYLKNGKNVTASQSERWGGDYPLTVLEEAMKRVAPRIGVSSSRDVADHYPQTVKYRDALENIIRDIGLETLTFEVIRNKNVDFAVARYGMPPALDAMQGQTSGKSHSSGKGKATGTTGKRAQQRGLANQGKANAVSVNDPRSVTRALREFSPKGRNRNKVVTLLEEARLLKLGKHPHAFCFVLRSMFELSAKAYCEDHRAAGGPSVTKASGEDKKLADVLREITTHLIKNNTQSQMTKALHGAITELDRPERILSVTSMNQLVHNPKFSVNETHICSVFNNIFPLLEEMNR